MRIEALEPRRLLAAHVFGTVFSDLNGNNRRDPGEVGVEGVVLFDDANNTAPSTPAKPI